MLDDEVVRTIAVEVTDADAIDAADVIAQLEGLVAIERRTRPAIGRRGRKLASVHDGRDAPAGAR